ncbi:BTAD domain-containing putative transcriptional regulator [Kribbella sp. VKM Ac-2566]|uniref:AfsR/SARP family transcriptional regulator n=1 Tax=Kribbella sp. VKM Ac-2566 TaxID=2512218 RepID=UPI0010DE0034|nr:BTAD domain-containing putative transcriptional regulator [Kribbella sp. VKM Ac-2566]TDW88609.1 DNA-binding SARP family transcriptional activator [Kribbella sp. VKM Ac-2566]
MEFGVLGPVVAWESEPADLRSARHREGEPADLKRAQHQVGEPIDLKGAPVDLRGPRHRAVLARLIVARGRVVPAQVLVDDLWVDPPAGALSAVRTFVAALRRAIEPERAPREPPRLLVTSGPGYALKTTNVDAWHFENALRPSTPSDGPAVRAAGSSGESGVRASAPRGGSAVGAAGASGGFVSPEERLHELLAGLGLWRGPAYAEFVDEPWALAERARLTELRLHAVEQIAEARLELGLAAEAVPDLDAHVIEHPWREDAWRLLALALYRSERQGDALAVLRRARETLVGQLGIDPGPTLTRLETDILNHAAHLTPPAQRTPPAHLTQAAHLTEAAEHTEAAHLTQPGRGNQAGRVRLSGEGSSGVHLTQVGSVWAEAAAAYDRAVGGTRARIESTVGLLRNLAVTGGGGLEAARRHRLAAIAAAEELGDPDLTARVIGAYDVPAIWTRSDDEAQAAAIVAAAERALPTQDHASIRARLLATIALESRGSRSPRAREAALEAEQLARGLDDPALLAFTLNGVFMQTCHRAGLAPQRDAIGAELITLSQRHNLFTYEVLGHLIRLQSACARADHTTADDHAGAADALAARHELPLVAVFTRWYAALRDDTPESYRAAAALLDDAGMPGLSAGLLPLALAAHAVRHGEPIPTADYGPHAPWVYGAPDPPPGLLLEVYWALTAHSTQDPELLAKAQAALAPAADEHAAGSGLLTLGPIADYLA